MNKNKLFTKGSEILKKENEHFRKVFSNKYDAYIYGDIGGNVNEQEYGDYMTGKRFEFRLYSNELYYFYIFDNETGKEYKYLVDDELLKLLNEFNEENEYLKQEIAKFKEEEKHIGDVKREDLDRVFKMSIYEIAEAFEYYRKKIKELKSE